MEPFNTQETSAMLAEAGWLRGLAQSLVHDASAADDLAQETMIRALEHPPSGRGSMRGFLNAILRNTARQRARSESRRAERERAVARPERLPAELDSMERLALHRRLVSAVEALDEPYRSSLLLRYFDQLPPREIAARLGLPVKTVNTRLARGLEKLRAELDREWDGDRRAWLSALVPLLGPRAMKGALALGSGAFVAKLAASFVVLTLLCALGWRALRSPSPAAERVAAASTNSIVNDPPNGDSISSGLRRPVEAVGNGVTGPKLAVLSGRVLTSEGIALAGAQVEARYRPAAGLDLPDGAYEHEDQLAAETRSDASGRFELKLPVERPFELHARAAGYGSELRRDVCAGEEIDVSLARAASLALEIVSKTDATPCAGAAVWLTHEGPPDRLWDGSTDEYGRCLADDLAPGAYIVNIEPRLGSPTYEMDVLLSEGKHSARRIEVFPGRVLRGRAISARTGLPVAGAIVEVRGKRTGQVRCDALGEFELSGLSSQSVIATITARAPEFASCQRSVKLEGAQYPRLELALEPAESRPSAHGRIVDEQGAPLAGALVAAYGLDWIETKSGADGGFEISGLDPASQHLLYVRLEGCAIRVQPFPEAAQLTTSIDLGDVVLAPGARVSGRVRARSGEPLSGTVVAYCADPIDSGIAQAPNTTIAVGIARSASSVVDHGAAGSEDLEQRGRLLSRRASIGADGEFSIGDLPAGTLLLEVHALGMARAPSTRVELSAGERRQIDLDFEAGLSIEGRVLASDGTPLIGAWVTLRGEDGGSPHGTVLTGRDGTFRLLGLEPRRYAIQARYNGTIDGPGGPLRQARVDRDGLVPPLQGLELRLRHALGISGRVLRSDGTPLPDARIDALDSAGHRWSAVSRVGGNFDIDADAGTTSMLTVVWSPPLDKPEQPAAELLRAELGPIDAGSVDVIVRLSGSH